MNHNKGFRLPTIVGVLLAIFTAGALIMLFERYSRTQGSASGSTVPTNISVANISDTAFSVIWTTDFPATGMVSIISPKHSPSTFFDDRDATGKMKPYTTHMVTLRTLTPATRYTFRILANGKAQGTQGNTPLSATTAPPISGKGTGLEPAYGTIQDGSGRALQGALVLVTLQQGQLLSTLSSASGSWIVPLALSRNASLSAYLDGSNRLTEAIRILANNQEATALTDTLNDAPVPVMVLGKSYDFRKQQASNTRDTQKVLGESTTAKPSGTRTIGLTLPAQNASLPTTLPLIAGTGLPGKTVSVVVGIANPIGGTAIVGTDGLWKFTPPKPLGTGMQSVTATTVNEKGKPVAFTHTFTILKSGTQVLGEATPSATLTPTITPESTPSATPTPTPQLQGEPVPTSGTTLPTLLIILLGAGLLTSGFVIKWKYA